MTQQEAEQEWREYIDKFSFEVDDMPKSVSRGRVFDILCDYKQALRAEIEKEREAMKKHCEAYHMENFMSHTDEYFKKILDFLNTVVPLKRLNPN